MVTDYTSEPNKNVRRKGVIINTLSFSLEMFVLQLGKEIPVAEV